MGSGRCASLLHVPKAEMSDVRRRMITALKPGGVWLMSFKKGKGEAVRNSRFFNDYDETEFRTPVEQYQQLTLLQLWMTRMFERDENKNNGSMPR